MRQCRLFIALVALAVSTAVPASALLSCVADQTVSVMTKMACCKAAKPNCGASSQGTMECCKTGTHSDQQNVAKVLTFANPLKTSLLIFPTSTLVLQPLLARPQRERVMLCAGTTSPPRFAFSALLI